jgi:phosphoribosylanthranilate isomerase
VDLNSGVEDAPGKKSRAKLAAALDILRRHRRADAKEKSKSF